MMLRSFPFRAMLAASMAIAVMPLYSQSSNLGQQASQSPYPGSVVEEIVARVNDQVISTSDYARAEQELEQEGRQQNWSAQQLDDQKRDLLRSLIDKQLLLSKGKELGITGEDELVHRLDEIRKQNHLDSLEDLQKAAEAQGVSYEDFKQQIREGIITSQVIRDQVGRHIQITPSDIQAYYNAHKSEFQQPEQVRLSEILVPTANPDDTTEVAAAQKKSEALEAKLKGGSAFAALAKENSGGPTAAQGGDLGEFKQGQLAPVLEQDTFSLKAGQFTQPIRTKQGFVILKVTDHQDAGVAPLKDVEGQIEDQIGYSKMEPALRAYLTKLRQEAYIEIRSGYVDSGAAPNEVKMNYSAYVPPSPKHKRHEVRTRFEGRGRGRVRKPKTEVAKATNPSNVPTLDQVNASHKKAKHQKPGRKEKIRFGQAPREALPAGPARGEEDDNAQIAADNSGDQVPGDGNAVPAKKEKRRYSSEAGKKHARVKDNHQAPATVGSQEAADLKEQESSLGLNGNTPTKKRKPSKSGPKRRYSDEDKKQPTGGSNGTQPATPAPTPQP
jgi:peptidyl-prolyl cis-trans isomerase SurA